MVINTLQHDARDTQLQIYWNIRHHRCHNLWHDTPNPPQSVAVVILPNGYKGSRNYPRHIQHIITLIDDFFSFRIISHNVVEVKEYTIQIYSLSTLLLTLWPRNAVPTFNSVSESRISTSFFLFNEKRRCTSVCCARAAYSCRDLDLSVR